MNLHFEHFDASTATLLPGTNLIEASAGTGKTFAIAQLVVRFVVEKGIPIESILVVTFTRAATAELKARIRQRLYDAQLALSGEGRIAEDLSSWIEHLTLSQMDETQLALYQQRIQQALLALDQAAIYTIHGFSQTLLKQFALESGQAFEVEALNDFRVQKQSLVYDFWRKLLYPATTEDVKLITQYYDDPSKLAKEIMNIDFGMRIVPEIEAPQQALRQQLLKVEAEKQAAIACWEKVLDLVRPHIGLMNGNVVKSYQVRAQRILDWLKGQAALDKGDKVWLSYEKFEKSFKKDDLAVFESLNLDIQPVQRYERLLSGVSSLVLRAALDYVQQGLKPLAENQNLMTFDDMVRHLSEALDAPSGKRLMQTIRRAYPVAMIDEFQDTDSHQWHTFSKVFAEKLDNKREKAELPYLYLIGDPKQAIYKFRGADIYTYFKAQKHAEHRYTLEKNWRSNPRMVTAVNHIFTPPPYQINSGFNKSNTPFNLTEMIFHPVKAAKSEQDGALLKSGQTVSAMPIWYLQQQGDGALPQKAAKAQIVDHVLDEILQLINQDQDYTIQTQSKTQKVTPKDIAILVASHKDATQFQDALRQVGVPAAMVSRHSVFQSASAQALLSLLIAVAAPKDTAKARMALTSDWLGLNGQAYFQFLNDAHALDGWIQVLHDWHHIWQSKGLMVLMNHFLAYQGWGMSESVQSRLLRRMDGERWLTDIWHLAELIQTEANENQLGILKVLQWVQQQCLEGQSLPEETKLRLESDASAVTIMTMHASKGLEFPIVFCVGLGFRSKPKVAPKNVVCHDATSDERILDIQSNKFEQHKAQAEKEALSEEVRKLYVAVTRAKYRCYVIGGNIRERGNSKEMIPSALHHLVYRFDESINQNPVSAFKQVCDSSDELTCEYVIRPEILPPLEPYHSSEAALALSLPTASIVLSNRWRMTSYSALARRSISNSPEEATRQDETDNISAEWREEAEQAGDEDFNPLPQSSTLESIAALSLIKGAHFGNLVHDCFEHITFDKIAEQHPDFKELREKQADYYGVSLSPEQTEAYDEMMRKACLTLLSDNANFSLSQLAPTQCLKEMPFYLNLPQMNLVQLNELTQHSPFCQPLQTEAVEGYLTGFIDLVCEFEGKFYVMDYKSNYLDSYDPDAIEAAMHHHNYGLQYWIYSLVLHLYLKKRLVDYDYQRHFGGVRYLFVRGMAAEFPLQGVFQDRLRESQVEQMEALFQSEGA